MLTGGAAQCEGTVGTEIDRLALAGRIRRPGRVPRADLDGLVDGAVALTFPSRFEGFGAPVLEAMARGCPVLAADATALPEVVGHAGVLLPSDAPEAWADAMADLLDRPERRARLRAAGLARAAGFGWDRAAGALEDAYRRSLALAPTTR